MVAAPLCTHVGLNHKVAYVDYDELAAVWGGVGAPADFVDGVVYVVQSNNAVFVYPPPSLWLGDLLSIYLFCCRCVVRAVRGTVDWS